MFFKFQSFQKSSLDLPENGAASTLDLSEASAACNKEIRDCYWPVADETLDLAMKSDFLLACLLYCFCACHKKTRLTTVTRKMEITPRLPDRWFTAKLISCNDIHCLYTYTLIIN